MDITSFQAAAASLKAAADISRALLQMKVSAEVQAKVIELQSALLEAQNSALAATAAQFTLIERVETLEQQLKQRESWTDVRRMYRLVNPWRGAAQAYALKRDAADGEQPHLLCANCFQNARRSPLNPVNDKNHFVQMVCPTCRASMETGLRGIGPAKYAEEYADVKS